MARHVFRLLGAVLTLYLVTPLLLFAVRALRGPQRGFHVGGLFPAFFLSVSCATVSLVIIVLGGVPLAFLLARTRTWWSRLLEVLVTLPLALPPVMGGIVMVYLVGPYSWLGQVFHRQLTESVYGIVIAMTFTSAPYLILSARAAFSTVDPVLVDVAATLGHGEASRFFRVAVPLAGPGIRAGMIMTWLRAFGEYGAVTILAYNPASLPVYTLNEFMARGLAPTVAPTLLSLIVAAAVVLVGRVTLRRPRRVTPLRPGVSPPPATPARPSFDITTDLGDFHLDVHHRCEHDSLAILGPSGSGKSVLLRSLLGLYGPSVGRVGLGGRDVSTVPPEHRGVGYVAQGFSLFPHLSVWNNVMFPVNSDPDAAHYWLERLGVHHLAARMPAELSGGERQRVALAQALCRSPGLVVLDEPFSALDVPIRRELQRTLRQLQRETTVSLIIVTHDPLEAVSLARELLVMEDGRCVQVGESTEVHRHPASRRVATLLDRANVLDARATPRGLVDRSGTLLATKDLPWSAEEPVLWSLQPESLRVVDPESDGDAGSGEIVLTGTVLDVVPTGLWSIIDVRLSEEWELTIHQVGASQVSVGETCGVVIHPGEIDVWTTSSTRR